MKKVLLSSIAMAMFFAGSLGLFILVACSEPKPMNEEEAKEEQKDPVVSVELEPEFDSLELVIEEEPEDYWEEKRKHSPNDNYLLGFDEDVDDVHDMEIYMEDY